ncbi:MAG: hypothetical protein A4E65_03274 [Syntrophorhabdus sp. PtaU1.Bin153]|nr:MAG: hypothetical protein A4E65_03274 [Syntrophorhabdus sp. PtaU1.Bin153]
MNYMLLSILIVVCIICVAVIIYVLLGLRRTMKKMDLFISSMESSLKPALDELTQALKGIKQISDNLVIVTDDARALSGSVRSTGENIRLASGYIESVVSSSAFHVSGVKAGIMAGMNVLVKHFLGKHKKQIERR